jgi:hypothetical protein
MFKFLYLRATGGFDCTVVESVHSSSGFGTVASIAVVENAAK